jgi:hypothetical protein
LAGFGRGLRAPASSAARRHRKRSPVVVRRQVRNAEVSSTATNDRRGETGWSRQDAPCVGTRAGRPTLRRSSCLRSRPTHPEETTMMMKWFGACAMVTWLIGCQAASASPRRTAAGGVSSSAPPSRLHRKRQPPRRRGGRFVSRWRPACPGPSPGRRSGASTTPVGGSSAATPSTHAHDEQGDASAAARSSDVRCHAAQHLHLLRPRREGPRRA